MDDEDADETRTRAPTLEDLVSLCRNLNAQGAKYLVVGGFAIIQHGYTRSTGDIDILIADSRENQKFVREALKALPNQAILELGEDEDIREWVVLRVSDEVLVDVMTAACGVSFAEAEPSIQFVDVAGVRIPYASPQLLLRMKQTHRSKDEVDRSFLQWKIANEAKGADGA